MEGSRDGIASGQVPHSKQIMVRGGSSRGGDVGVKLRLAESEEPDLDAKRPTPLHRHSVDRSTRNCSDGDE